MPVDYRMESSARRTRAPESRPISVWWSSYHQLAEQGDYPEWAVLGIRTIFPFHSAGRPAICFPKPGAGRGSCSRRTSRRSPRTDPDQSSTCPDRKSADGRKTSRHFTGRELSDYAGVVLIGDPAAEYNVSLGNFGLS